MAEKKILLIDDEEDLLRMNTVKLAGFGYEVITASDGKEGIKKASEEKPDLILLDFTMPGMDGFEVLRSLKDNANTVSIPVIMLTGRGERHLHIKAQLFGASGYITKPFNSDALLDTIKRHLS